MKGCSCPLHRGTGELFPLSDFGKRSDRIDQYLSRRHKCLYRIQVERGYKKPGRKKTNPNEKTLVKFECHFKGCGKRWQKTQLWHGRTVNLDGTRLRGFCPEHQKVAKRMVAFHTDDQLLYA